jgi:hypothetical protein
MDEEESLNILATFTIHQANSLLNIGQTSESTLLSEQLIQRLLLFPTLALIKDKLAEALLVKAQGMLRLNMAELAENLVFNSEALNVDKVRVDTVLIKSELLLLKGEHQAGISVSGIHKK